MNQLLIKAIIIFVFSLSLIFVSSCNDSDNNIETTSTESSSNDKANTSKRAITKNINAKEFSTLYKTNKYTLVDVRTPREFKAGHIKGAININLSTRTFKDDIQKIAKDKPVLVYCKSGARSRNAMAIMAKVGFPEVYNLKRGYSSWKRAGLK